MTDHPSERIRQLDPALTRGLVSRRGMLAGIGATGLASLLAACGTKGTAGKANPTAQAATDRSDTEKVVSWSNWPEYIDVDDKTKAHPTLDGFTKKTGIKVTYTEDYNDNDEFFAKVQPQLRAGADTGRDVWCSTDWMVAKLIRLNWVQKLDKANIPNAKNVQDALANVEFDPGRQFSLPWQSGFTGIGYNPKATGGRKIENMDQLLTDKTLKGKVTLLTEMRDTVGMMLLAMGKDPKDSGQLKGFTGNEYGKGLASGDIAACLAWTGDVVQLQADNPSLGYTLPSSGHLIWSDNFVIPNKAKHKKNAEALINYYYDPAVMSQVVDYVNYISVVKGAEQLLLADDPDVAKNPLIFPSEAVLGRAHVFRGLTEAEETKYNKAFQALTTGG
jgi:spermidine/putrescine transport system substrate-binding protein